jgi:hypothetical protein
VSALLTLAGPALAMSGFGLYMLTSNRGRFRRIPWEFLALSLLGGLISLGRVIAVPTAATLAAALVSVGFLGFLAWFFFVHTMYGPREDRPRVGDRFPEFRLPTSEGAVYDFAGAHGRRRLLIFYRGSW